MTYKFEVMQDGVSYQCERVVTGTRKLTQKIYVLGCGSKTDSASYGPGWHPVETMPGIAILIADEIINEAKARARKMKS